MIAGSWTGWSDGGSLAGNMTPPLPRISRMIKDVIMREMGANRRSHRLGRHRHSHTKDASGGSSAQSLSTAENCQPRRGSGRASLRMMHDDGGHNGCENRSRVVGGADTQDGWPTKKCRPAQIAKALGLTRCTAARF